MDDAVRLDLAVQLAAGRMRHVLRIDLADLNDDERADAIASASGWLDAADAAGLAVLSPNPDRTHYWARTAYTADVMAACARVLAYAAENGRGLTYPASVDRLLGPVSSSVFLLKEVMERCALWLGGEQDAGRLRLDGSVPDGDLDEHMAKSAAALAEVATAAAEFCAAAERARRLLDSIGATEDSDGTSSDERG